MKPIAAELFALEFNAHPDRWYLGRQVIEKLEAATPLTSCGNCRHWHPFSSSTTVGVCRLHNWTSWEATDFCSLASTKILKKE